MSVTVDWSQDPAGLAALLVPGGPADKATKRVAERTVVFAKQLAPIRTGALRTSIHMEPAPKAAWRVVASMPYAAFVHDGTVPHVIKAKKAPMLHWIDAGGEHRFAKLVHHPGTKPQPFLKEALILAGATL